MRETWPCWSWSLLPSLFIELTKLWQQAVFYFRQYGILFLYSHLLCLPPCSSQIDISFRNVSNVRKASWYPNWSWARSKWNNQYIQMWVSIQVGRKVLEEDRNSIKVNILSMVNILALPKSRCVHLHWSVIHLDYNFQKLQMTTI